MHWRSIVLALTAMCAVSEARAADPVAESRYMPEDLGNYEVHHLDNGLTTLLNSRRGAPYIALRVVVDFGTYDYGCGQRELPHLLEHLMFSGYGEIDEADLDAIISSYGGRWNAETKDRTTVFDMTFHSRYAMQVLLVLSGMFADTEISELEFRTARDVVDAEMGTDVNEVQRLMYRHGIFLGHAERAFSRFAPESYAFCENLEDTKQISRQDVINAYETYYTPANITIIAVGDFDTGAFQENVALFFGPWEKSGKQSRDRSRTNARYVETVYPTRLGEWVGEESYVSIDYGIPTYNHSDRHELAVIRAYLSEEMFEAFRIDDGVSYDPNAYIRDHDEFSILGLEAQVDTAEKNKALDSIRSIMRKLRTDGIARDNIDFLRNSRKLRLATLFDSNTDIADYYVSFLDDWRESGAFPDHDSLWDSVTPESVTRVANQYLVKERSLTFVHSPLFSYRELALALVGLASILLLLVGATIRYARRGAARAPGGHRSLRSSN